MQLRPCVACRRHVEVSASTCPFCDAAIATVVSSPVAPSAGRLSRAASFAGATLAGCIIQPAPQTTPPPPPPPDRGTAIVAQPTPPPPDAGTFAQPPPDATATPAAPGSVQGVVQDQNGRRVPGASVSISGGSISASTTTNARGEFVFASVPPGSYVVTADAPRYIKGEPDPTGLGTIGADPLRSITVMSGAVTRPVIAVTLPPPVQAPPYDDGPCCKPYGAPPARRRVV